MVNDAWQFNIWIPHVFLIQIDMKFAAFEVVEVELWCFQVKVLGTFCYSENTKQNWEKGIRSLELLDVDEASNQQG